VPGYSWNTLSVLHRGACLRYVFIAGADLVPKLRRPHVASPDEVKITREGDTAIFEYADPSVATTHFAMRPGELAKMTDAELLDYWNAYIEATDEFLRTQKFTLTEIPPGKPQVEYHELSDQWVPRGHVVRAVILTDCAIEPDLDEPFVAIDDRDFSLREFFRMVGTFGGWGMRIAFVGDENTHERPKIKVREPKEPRAKPVRGKRSRSRPR
jgi:hypothetical protein